LPLGGNRQIELGSSHKTQQLSLPPFPAQTMELITKVIPTPGTVYKPSDPFLAQVIENTRLTPKDSADDIHNIVLDLSRSEIAYLEGQSVGILPPGVDEDGKKHRVRLYSIASSRVGDDGTSKTVTLCVKRVVFTDEATGQEVRGVASNHICDAKVGEDLALTGPTGRKFLLPQDDQVNLIMVAVGTGIAPFRAFIKYIFHERGSWGGKISLFFGAKTGFETLYMNQENNDIGQYYTKETFQAFQALSRQEKTSTGERVYVQHKIAEQRESLWPGLKAGKSVVYLCGLKGMEAGVDKVFGSWAEQDGMDWEAYKEELKATGRWNVEVY